MKHLLAVNIGSRKFGDEFRTACAERSIALTDIRAKYCCIELVDGSATLFHKGERIVVDAFDYAFVRVKGNYPLMVSLMCRLLAGAHVPFNDDVNLDHTKNDEKVTQMLVLAEQNVAIPDTLLFSIDGIEENWGVISARSFPCVLKTNGSRGRNVWKIDSAEALREKLRELDPSYEVAMVQAYVPNTYDIRALYLYDECIGAMKRTSADGFYNNVGKGGAAEAVTLTLDEDTLARAAIAALKRDFSGVDIVQGPGGPLILEVNLAPQVYGFEEATGINVPDRMVEIIDRTFSNRT